MPPATDAMHRTLQALDWAVVLERLAHHCRTLRGARAAVEPDFAPHREATLERYAAVEEVWLLEAEDRALPVGQVADMEQALARATRGEVLESHELMQVGRSLRALSDLAHWLGARREQAPVLAALAAPIEVDPELSWRLESSFDERGELSAETYPEIGALRTHIHALEERIRSTLREILDSEEMSGVLQDRYVTERGGRHVIPVRTSRRSGVGIVHDRSQSGETVFVEPTRVVEPHNALREAQGQLRHETHRILAALSRLLDHHAATIERSLEAATRIDLACARAGLGRAWAGVIPRVGTEGTIHLQAARHPVLVLRGVKVVPNDLRLDAEHPGLVLTGPNTGGKTVALKTLGLCALLTAAGIPLPSGETSRVDFFPTVLAAAGDRQSVQGDLSTFSAQVLVLREAVEQAGPGVLVLLDEVAAGTDPAQGSALARAVLESVVASGARVAVTTHYLELKVLGAQDRRFAVGAVQQEHGEPTYQVAMGLPGQSHALSVAVRLDMDAEVLARARELLDTGSRDLADLMEQLDEERAALARRTREVEKRQEELEDRLRSAERERERLAARRRAVREQVGDPFRDRLARQEREVARLVAALQANPNLKDAGRILASVRQTREDLEEELAPPEPPPDPPARLHAGRPVYVRPVRERGEVTAVQGNRVQVRIGALRTWVEREDLEDLKGKARSSDSPRSDRAAARPSRRSSPRRHPPSPDSPAEERRGVRTPANSCDLRGRRVDEAVAESEQFLDRMLLRGEPVAFLLHGHGTGALKRAIRSWLPDCPHVVSWRPAREDEGGDAWTVAVLS